MAVFHFISLRVLPIDSRACQYCKLTPASNRLYDRGMKRIACSLLLLVVLTLGVCVDAAVRVSANPTEGGGTLRLGRVDEGIEQTKAVRIRVSSDDGRQFQVFQRLAEPLTSAHGTQLNYQSFVSYAVSGSNASGTLYAQSREPLGPADQLIFTSSPDGQSDTLTMAYMVEPARVTAQGEFIGRIGYTVRSVGQGFQNDVILPVSVEVQPSWRVAVTGKNNRDRIYLKTGDALKGQDGLVIECSGNNRQEVKIYHQIQELPVNAGGDLLPQDAVEVKVSGGESGAGQFTLSNKRQLIASVRQESQKLDVTYLLNSSILSDLKSGTYRGRAFISVDSPTGNQEFPINLEVEVKPKLDIEVVLPPGGVRFANVLPTDPPQTKEIVVRVSSNVGKPYIVMQNVASALVSPKGDEISKEHFAYKMQWMNESKGRLGASDFTPVAVGETPVFYSDRSGSSAEFKVIYRLGYYPGMSAGDYAVPIVFSLGEM